MMCADVAVCYYWIHGHNGLVETADPRFATLDRPDAHGFRGFTGRVRKNCTACWLVMHERSSSDAACVFFYFISFV